MKEDRGREHHRIQSVNESAMPGDKMPPVLDALVALDGRHHQPAKETHDCNQQGHKEGLPESKGRHPPKKRAKKAGRQDTAQKTLPGF